MALRSRTIKVSLIEKSTIVVHSFGLLGVLLLKLSL